MLTIGLLKEIFIQTIGKCRYLYYNFSCEFHIFGNYINTYSDSNCGTINDYSDDWRHYFFQKTIIFDSRLRGLRKYGILFYL